MKILICLASLLLILSCDVQTKKEIVQPSLPLDKLKGGNERFYKNTPAHPDESSARKDELENGQHPFAVVVSCSDSRVAPELLFDQGLGDLFIIRTAGNVIGDLELGSIEYAVEHLHCNLVVVMGHSNCGAVGAYLESHGEKHEDHIQHIVDYIGAEEEVKLVDSTSADKAFSAIKANAQHGVNLLKNSMPVLKPLVDKGELTIIGAYYNLEDNKVTFQ
jgi:carbonic anhydrase